MEVHPADGVIIRVTDVKLKIIPSAGKEFNYKKQPGTVTVTPSLISWRLNAAPHTQVPPPQIEPALALQPRNRRCVRVAAC